MRVQVWSGPRCLSTALMYSFSRRSDCVCFDEPLYAHHLRCCPEVFRPYREELMRAQDPDGAAVLHSLATQPLALHGAPRRVLYAKHMAKQRVGLACALLTRPEFLNVVLVRHPQRVIASFRKKSDEWTAAAGGGGGGGGVDDALCETLFAETSFGELGTLFDELSAALGRPPVVVSADRLQADPEATLRALCAALGLRFEPDMVHWPAGPKECDGIWAYHWYDGVHASTGFRPTPLEPLPAPSPTLEPLLERSLPIYLKILAAAVGVPVANE